MALMDEYLRARSMVRRMPPLPSGIRTMERRRKLMPTVRKAVPLMPRKVKRVKKVLSPGGLKRRNAEKG